MSVFAVITAVVGLAPWILKWAKWEVAVYFTLTSFSALWWWIWRRRAISLNVKLDYGVLERLLHWVALEPTVVRRLAFDLECHFSLPDRASATSCRCPEKNPAARAVYVCGLARSGTTMLMRVLAATDVFRSLTYRDMPFVLAPNLWRTVTQFATRKTTSTERAHGDGIQVDYDSSEGFEEVFWRTFSTITADGRYLNASKPSAETLSAFADYRASVTNPRRGRLAQNDLAKRYLSKNNNNLLRLSSLCADPTATLLIVYRDPIATAISLHRQHQRFSDLQKNYRFTQAYMRWLVHHEFGLDHRPFCFALPNDGSQPITR
jgi:hypothetical protein